MTPEQYARAKELFTEAIRLPAGELDDLLARHSTEPSEVLAEVRSLLKHHSQQTLLVASEDTLPAVHPSSKESQTSTGHTQSTTSSQSGFFRLNPRGYLALGIALACLLLGLVNFLSRLASTSTLKELRASTLTSALDVTVEALELWIQLEKNQVNSVARDPELRRHTELLIEQAGTPEGTAQLAQSASQTSVRTQLRADFEQQVKYAIWDRRFVTIADWSNDGTGLGTGVSAYGAGLLTRVFDGSTIIQFPGDHLPITKNYPIAKNDPVIGVIAPIRDQQKQIIAAILVYGYGAEARFNDILGLAQFGKSGETYAFDKNGVMLSKSRFIDQLVSIGLLKGDDSSQQINLRDPGGDMTRGFRPTTPPETWNLTEMVRYAVAGRDGFNLNGYRDYRGVMVVGAWKWLPKYEIGVATELDLAELSTALKPLHLQSQFKFALLAGALGVALYSYYSLDRLRRSVGTNSQVGQYTLEEKIGEGGMGVVYKARHALLKRPTAIKLLKSDITNKRTVAWFEREVQLASQLTHPNTIDIYDYGVTPEGLFYYVMEYLDGLNLVQVVSREGALPPERVTHILRQIAGSLCEAHHIGLVHRDIKPQNIMLCQRVCETDVVKVLDFGLVKEVQSTEQRASTVLAGTPIYMAPERISSPGLNDPRMDLYSLGAVGFFLLSGQEIFAQTSGDNILHDIVHTVPPRVSQCVDQSIPDPLVNLIESCLAKDAGDRPRDIDAVLEVLDQLDMPRTAM